MYKKAYVGHSEASDFAVAMFLEEPSSVAVGWNRLYYNAEIDSGSSYGMVRSGWKIRQSSGFVFHTCPLRTPQGNVRVTLVSSNYGTLVDKTIPYSPTFGISISELPSSILSHLEDTDTITWRIYNNTGVIIVLCYLTSGPLAFFNSRSGLLSADCGESMGDDEYLPQFGVSHMYGSFEVKDDRGMLLSMLSDPASFGLDENLARYGLRCEFYVGTQMAGLMETDEFSFSEDNKRIGVSLKSVLYGLDSVPGFGPRVVSLSSSRSFSSALTEFFSYSKSVYGDVLSKYDFGAIPSNPHIGSYSLNGPLALEGGTTMLGFIDKVGQAVGATIGIRHVLTTSMQYQFTVYPWMAQTTNYEQPLDSIAMQYAIIQPYELVGDIQYTPLKKNYVDKITYTSYTVREAEDESTHSIEYPLIDIADYVGGSVESDKASFLSHWSALSPSSGLPSNNPLETTYGMRIPRPSDISYDYSAGKYVAPIVELQKSEARALTRGFLWRFRFTTEFTDNPFASTEVSDILSTMEGKSVFGGDGSFNDWYMVFPREGAYDSAGSASSFEFYGVTMSQNYKVVRYNGAKPSRMLWPESIFSDFKSHYTLHYKIPGGVYLIDGESYELKKSFSFWYSPQFGYNPWDVEDLGVYGPDVRYWGTTYQNVDDDGVVHEKPSLATLTQNTNYHDMKVSMSKISDYFTLRSSALQRTTYTTIDTSISPGTIYLMANSSGVYNLHEAGSPYQDGGNYYVGMCNDMDGGYGAPIDCFNVDDSEHSGEQTIWPCAPINQGVPTDGKIWYHSGFSDDRHAKGDASDVCMSSVVTASSLMSYGVKYGIDGSFYIKSDLPSASVLRSTIKASEDNFLDKTLKTEEKQSWSGTEDTGAQGQAFANSCNPYFTLWSINALWCLKSNHNEIYRADSPQSSVRWATPRPSYGFCIRSVMYSVSGRFLEISHGDEVVAQYNAQNQYNYDMATNELMTDNLTIGSKTSVGYLLEEVSSRYASGKTVYWAKIKARGIYKPSSATLAPFVRHYYLNDPVYQLSVMQGGVSKNLAGSSGAVVRSVEYVMDGGECHVNLRLIEA